MRRRLRRPLTLAVLGAATAVTLSACQPTLASSAATVGNQSISTSALAARVDRSLQNPTAKAQLGGNKAAFTRRVLGLLINHDIVVAAAKKEGVSVTQPEINAQLQAFASQAGGLPALQQQAAASGITAQDLPGYVGDILLAQRIGQKLVANTPVPASALQTAYEQNYVQVHVAHILVKTQALADQILAKVKANPSSFAALAKQYSIDPGSKNKGGDLGTQSPAQYVAPFAKAVMTAPVGSYVVVHSQFGWHVIHVISRTETMSYAQALPQLRQQALQQTMQQKLAAFLVKFAGQLHVRVNPRFGTWDAKTGQVNPPAGSSPTPSSNPTPSPSPTG